MQIDIASKSFRFTKSVKPKCGGLVVVVTKAENNDFETGIWFGNEKVLPFRCNLAEDFEMSSIDPSKTGVYTVVSDDGWGKKATFTFDLINKDGKMGFFTNNFFGCSSVSVSLGLIEDFRHTDAITFENQ